MTLQDTLHTASTPQQAAPKAAVAHKTGSSTPQEIISRLPATATPWQQDSAVRANTKFEEVDWSQRQQPLSTPGLEADSVEELDLSQPLYHSRSLLNTDSVYRPEVMPYKQGVAGDPVPYSIAGDDLITSILIGCFVMGMVSISKSGNFIQRQLKEFFHTHREGTTEVNETSSEMRFQTFLLLQTALVIALVAFFYEKNSDTNPFILPQYAVIGIFMGGLSVYFMLKMLLYSVVNWVFFDGKKNQQWMNTQILLTAGLGIMVFPVVLLMAYFNLSIEFTALYTCGAIILAKLLAFYKAYTIFFRKTTVIVQCFLYFCALEMMPLGALWGALVLTDNYLKVNF